MDQVEELSCGTGSVVMISREEEVVTAERVWHTLIKIIIMSWRS